MPATFSESTVEDATLDWLKELGFSVLHGPEILPGEAVAERKSVNEVILPERFREALRKLNPGLPMEALDEAFRKVTVPEHLSLISNNRAFHRMLVEGVPVECRRKDNSIGTEIVRLIDFADPESNDWLAVNQFTVIEGQHNRRPDIVIFINGLPLGVIELKNAADEDADIWAAFNQLQTYKQQISSLFVHNAVLVISDGLEARIGTISADKERFMPWRTIEGEKLAPATMPQLEVLLRGLFDKQRFLNMVRHFMVFEEDTSDGSIIKKMAGYHQFHAVNIAVDETIRAAGTGTAELREGYFAKRQPGGATGDKRVGVVWHTQGSGKSLTMVFYAGRLVLQPEMENPTLIILTDRNDLDDQLFGTFSRCHELLRQKPVQADSREHLRQLLRVASGGVIFTTIHKFFPDEKGGKHPELSKRRNIVVIADEAHRSQYDFVDGFAKHMRDAVPNASFIGFTGTPVEKTDANTRAVFGDYISIYDIQRAVEDKATVAIYYESRLAKLELKSEERPKIDPNFEEATEGEELEHKEKLKTKWAALEAVVGAEKRVGLIAADLVKHWDARQEAMETQVPYGGKAMIVCMSRRICFELYEAIRKLRPDWHSDDDEHGAMKIVMTGSASDPLKWQPHIRNKPRREALAKRFKNPKDPFKIVIVRDMWLTGFDAPCLHTMYLDKPMRSHGLMQAIARVNRVFKDKPGGLVVDYLGLAHDLKQALHTYTESGGTGKTAIDQEDAVLAMQEKYEVCRNFMHGFDWSLWTTGKPAQRLSLLPAAQEHILGKAAKEKKPEEFKQKFLQAVADLSKAFALAVPHEKAIAIRDDIGFFQAVRAALVKSEPDKKKTQENIDAAIRQIISRAVASDEVIDIFAAAGLKKPDVSILSDEFLAEVRNMPQKNLAVELLRKLLNNEIKIRSKKFLIQSKSFSKMLEESIRKYQNRAIEAAAVIQELIGLARQMREAGNRGEKLKLTEDEVAFYDALEVDDSAVNVLGEPTLKQIAHELVESIRNNVTIDWTERETVRAKIRVAVKRILRKHGYPPSKQDKATQTVLEQAELLCADWAEISSHDDNSGQSENKLWQQADAEMRKSQPPGVKMLRSLRGQIGNINCIVWSPDGRLLALPSDDKKIWLLNGEPRTLEGHNACVWRVAFNEGSSILASGSSDNTIKIWDVASKQLLRTLEGHRARVLSVTFGPLDRILASGSDDNTIKIWDVASGRLLRTLEGHKGGVYSVTFHPSGILASGGGDSTIKLWQVDNGKLLRTLEGHKSAVYTVAFEPVDRTTLASGSDDKTIRLWEMASGRLLRTLEGHKAGVDCLDFSPKGQLIASKSNDNTVRLWRTDTYKPAAVIEESKSDPRWLPGLAFHPKLPFLATVGSDPGTPKELGDRVVHVWELDYAMLLLANVRAGSSKM